MGIERACQSSRLSLVSASNYRKVDEFERARRPVLVGADVGFLIGSWVVVDIIGHTCIHALVDSSAVWTDVIIIIVRIYEIRISLNVV